MKTNFRKNDDSTTEPEVSNTKTNHSETKDLTPEEFEKFIVSSGAKGSFMIYRSAKKDDELGVDNL